MPEDEVLNLVGTVEELVVEDFDPQHKLADLALVVADLALVVADLARGSETSQL